MPDIIISDEAIQLWEKEIASLERENREILAKNMARIELLKRRLAAVPLFRTDYTPKASDEEQVSEEVGNPTETLPDAVRRMLGQTPMKRSVLIHSLKEAGFNEHRMGVNNAYFYSVVRRLIKNGTIKKQRGDWLTKGEKAVNQKV